MMEIAYICSPYKGNLRQRIRNRRYAREITKQAINAGYIPITPHLYITQVLRDRKPIEIEKGLNIGLELLNLCDVVIVGTRYGLTEGMKKEIAKAEVHDFPIKTAKEIVKESASKWIEL